MFRETRAQAAFRRRLAGTYQDTDRLAEKNIESLKTAMKGIYQQVGLDPGLPIKREWHGGKPEALQDHAMKMAVRAALSCALSVRMSSASSNAGVLQQDFRRMSRHIEEIEAVLESSGHGLAARFASQLREVIKVARETKQETSNHPDLATIAMNTGLISRLDRIQAYIPRK